MFEFAGKKIRKYQQLTWPVSATAEIYHRAGRPSVIRLLEASDNHPMKRRNHPTESANLPIIDRRNHRIDRSRGRNRSVESSRNRQIDSPVDQPSGPRNHQLIVNQFPVIVATGQQGQTLQQGQQQATGSDFYILTMLRTFDALGAGITISSIYGEFRRRRMVRLESSCRRRTGQSASLRIGAADELRRSGVFPLCSIDTHCKEG